MANESPRAAELEHLLTQLIRMLSPALSAGDADAPLGGPAGQARAAQTGAVQAGTAQTEAVQADAGRAEVRAGTTPSAEPGAGAIPAVSASEARALIELVSARGIAQGELAGLLGLDKSTVSRLAAGLERKGWIRRGRDDDNQRYVRLYLTPEGREVAGSVWQAWQSRQARILAKLSPDERAGLMAGLGGLVRGLAAEGRVVQPAGKGG
jgi:DNA-binding MarR family transcriptional regulator